MNIEVLNREKFEKYVFEPHSKPSIIVSISSYGEAPPFIVQTAHNKIEAYITLNFNDTDERLEHFGGMQLIQALEIAKFIKCWYTPEINIVVHCGAGQSRSAGVAAAILKYYTDSDTQIFDSRKYKPNMLCYRLVLNALMSMN